MATWAAVAAAACAIALAMPAGARAQNDQRARLHFESGASYYEAGEYEDALREFQRAYELSHRPQLFYDISLSYQSLGNFEEAANYLERYLAEVSEIENRANLEIRLRNLRARIAHGSDAQMEAEAETEAEGETAAETEASAETDTEAEAEAEGEAESETEDEIAQPGPEAPPAGDAGPNVPAIAGFSVAALGLVTAAIFGPLTIAEDSSLSSGCGATRTCTDDDLSTMRTFAVITDVGLGVSLAGAVVGAIFLFVGGGESASEERVGSLTVTPMASAQGAGIAIGGAL